MLEHAEKGRQILLQDDVLFWRVPPFLLMVRYLVILPPPAGTFEWRSGMVVPDMHEI